MLVQLTISDFAIIRHLEIHFRPGLNILSGETGAGKSIIINAVNLILGERASTDLIRTGSQEARVEALFQLPPETPVSKLLSDFGIPFSGDVLITRVISREGRNKIIINGSLATLQMLARLGALLISISGQHEHQSLLRPENHLYILDDFGGLSERRFELNALFSGYQSLKEERHALARKIKQTEERQDLSRFQLDEIEKAAVKKGEDRILEEERKRLQHAELLQHTVRNAYQMLYEKQDAVLSILSHCIKGMERGVEIDRDLHPIKEAIASAKVDLEEAALDLRNFLQNIVHNPYRLEDVEERLQIINRLKKKYGPTLEDILAFRDRLSTAEDLLEQERESLRHLDEKITEAEKDILARAAVLSEKRKKTAGELEASVRKELGLLDMRSTRFKVEFDGEGRFGENVAGPMEQGMRQVRADGLDRVEFMLSPNVGEDLRPLFRIASGGELSRIMLALKSILAATTSVETVIFDEVDAGIGGATAEVVGDKLQSLAGYHQLLCISHLHQIACKGTTHFLVEKKTVDDRTQTVITELDPESRVQEIARMLGGKTISSKAMAHAKELLS